MSHAWPLGPGLQELGVAYLLIRLTHGWPGVLSFEGAANVLGTVQAA